jgi:protein-disulfide isomerase
MVTRPAAQMLTTSTMGTDVSIPLNDAVERGRRLVEAGACAYGRRMRERVSRVLLVVLGVIAVGAALLKVTPSVEAQALLLPARGEPSASMVILLFSDFQCPSCAKAEATLKEVRDAFPKDVQVIFKHNPLPEHADAPLAHELAVEAARQGKFWEMHDLLFANQAKLKRADLDGYAQKLGLDTQAVAKALDGRTHRAVVERDLIEARGLGITGTPTIFLNGRRAAGMPPASAMINVIKSLLAGGDGTEPAPVPMTTFDLKGAPTKGPADAPVTIVEFSDFQCGFCLRANSTVAQILAKYQGKVRLVFKHYPLVELHRDAPFGHRAALAAHEQGKFWEMHDRLFANQRAMSRQDILAHAGTLGLDMTKFMADLDGPRLQAVLDRDLGEGRKVGVEGTPTFFINGTALVGAQPIDAFVRVIDKALADAAAPAAATAPR